MKKENKIDRPFPSLTDTNVQSEKDKFIRLSPQSKDILHSF